MTDAKKPFVCYKSGWSMNIRPRNAAGWGYFAGWMAVFGVLTGGLVLLDPESQSSARYAATVVGYVLLTALWAIAMTFWMKARSEVIDMDEFRRTQRANGRSQRRRSD